MNSLGAVEFERFEKLLVSLKFIPWCFWFFFLLCGLVPLFDFQSGLFLHPLQGSQ